jgi:hypothetical protein
MVKVEIFYNSGVDSKTSEIAEEIKYKFGGKVDVKVVDLSNESAPEEYGIINPPVAVIDGKKKIQLAGEDSLKEIITKVIF